RFSRDWSSDVCSSDLGDPAEAHGHPARPRTGPLRLAYAGRAAHRHGGGVTETQSVDGEGMVGTHGETRSARSTGQDGQGAPAAGPRGYSSVIVDGRDRAAARAMLRAVGLTDEDFRRPLIGIANTWAEVTPCNVHLRALAERVKEGVREAGGTPLEFN